jgi:tRNA-specific 2-thiouridylase
VGTSQDMELFQDELVIKNVNFLSEKLHFPFNGKAKIRYRQEDQNCEIRDLKNGKYRVIFQEKQRAVAAGQVCAVYDKNDFLVMS